MTGLTGALCLFFILTAISGTVSNKMDPVTMTTGQNFTLDCSTTKTDLYSFLIIVRNPKTITMLNYDFKEKLLTPQIKYQRRLTHFITNKNKQSITLLHVKPSDAGVYTCCYRTFEYDKEIEEESYLLMVSEPKENAHSEETAQKSSAGMSEPMILVFVLTSCTLLVVLLLVLWKLGPKVKTFCEKKNHNQPSNHSPVYEDMHAHRKQNPTYI